MDEQALQQLVGFAVRSYYATHTDHLTTPEGEYGYALQQALSNEHTPKESEFIAKLTVAMMPILDEFLELF